MTDGSCFSAACCHTIVEPMEYTVGVVLTKLSENGLAQ